MIELLVVVAIIAIMSAVAGPPIANYIRTYRIRTATQQVAASISAARLKAISKNVNLGVTFAVIGANQYRVVVDDDLTPQATGYTHWKTIGAEDWSVVLGMPTQVGTIETLPANVSFETGTSCGPPAPPGGWNTPTTWGIRFSRLGAVCALSACGVPGAGVPAYTSYIYPGTGGAINFCLRQQLSSTVSLRRWISLNSGGRVQVQP